MINKGANKFHGTFSLFRVSKLANIAAIHAGLLQLEALEGGVALSKGSSRPLKMPTTNNLQFKRPKLQHQIAH